MSLRKRSISMKRVAIISLVLLICGYIVLRFLSSDQVENNVLDIDDQVTSSSEAFQDDMNAPPNSPTENGAGRTLSQELSNEPNRDLSPPAQLANGNATEVIIIGSFADPDESTIFDREEREPINIGIVLNADNDEGWPQLQNEETISLGAPVTPSALPYGGAEEARPAIVLGEPLDVSVFLAGETSDTGDDKTIKIGETIEVPPEN
jgi:hypothetical protein